VQELVVVLEENADRDPIRRVATVIWESEVLSMMGVTVADDRVEELRHLPGVKRLDSPKIGSLMV
jgi:hypothetical protein